MSRFIASSGDSIVIIKKVIEAGDKDNATLDLNSDKVLPPLEKALMDVIIEWND
jgi:hypothetical protein